MVMVKENEQFLKRFTVDMSFEHKNLWLTYILY